MVQTINKQRHEDKPEPPEAHAWVALGNSLHGRDEDGTLIEYEEGDQYDGPIDRRTWVTKMTKVVPVDETGQVVEGYTPPRGIRESDTVDVPQALRKWRRNQGIRLETTTVTTYVCEICDAEFDTKDQLNGHQGKHAREAREDVAAGDEAGAAADVADATDHADDGDDAAESGGNGE